MKIKILILKLFIMLLHKCGFEPPLINSNFLNITAPGENLFNLVNLDDVTNKMMPYLEKDTSVSGNIITYS